MLQGYVGVLLDNSNLFLRFWRLTVDGRNPAPVDMVHIYSVVVSNMFYFHPHLGKIPNLTNIFQRGWNHQLVYIQGLIHHRWFSRRISSINRSSLRMETAIQDLAGAFGVVSRMQASRSTWVSKHRNPENQHGTQKWRFGRCYFPFKLTDF